MNALILAGGRGTRLLPYSTLIPKPLMPVGSHAILEILLYQLKAAGVKRAVLAVGHLSHLIRAYLGKGERVGIELDYVEESTPLGTAGPIGAALDLLGDRFILMNGDLLTTLDFGRLVQFHIDRKCAATIGTHRRDVPIEFGVLKTDAEQRLVQYDEKPTLSYLVSMGVYVVERAAVEAHVVPVRRLDAPDLMRLLIKDQREVCCYREDCYWLDIGRPDDYRLANEIVEKGEFPIPLPK